MAGKVIGRYGNRNERLADGDRLPDPLFAPVQLEFCDKCGRVKKFCTCEKVDDDAPRVPEAE